MGIFSFLKERLFSKEKRLEEEKIMAECGHETKLEDEISVFGNTENIELAINSDGKIAYCHTCVEKMAIQCAWCDRPIFIGSPITLKGIIDENYKIPEGVVVYNNSVVGCLRESCTDTVAERSGFWMPPGKVHRVSNSI